MKLAQRDGARRIYWYLQVAVILTGLLPFRRALDLGRFREGYK